MISIITDTLAELLGDSVSNIDLPADEGLTARTSTGTDETLPLPDEANFLENQWLHKQPTDEPRR